MPVKTQQTETVAEDTEWELVSPDEEAPNSATHERARKLAKLMDSQFRLPFTNFRVGLDGLIGWIPGIGDTLTLIPSLYFLYEARRHHAGLGLLLKMLGNILLDLVVGAIPVLGDLFDLAFKSNVRNAKLLMQFLERQRETSDKA